MAEYISREAANRAVLRAYALHGKGLQYIETMCQLGLVSSADVVERKRGEWYDRGSLSCRCSNCGCKSPEEFSFCPNCGADMRGEKCGFQPSKMIEKCGYERTER